MCLFCFNSTVGNFFKRVFLQSIEQKLIYMGLWLDSLEYVDIESMNRPGPWGVCHLAGDGASGVERQVQGDDLKQVPELATYTTQ